MTKLNYFMKCSAAIYLLKSRSRIETASFAVKAGKIKACYRTCKHGRFS